jgi:hypothetical protein
VARTSYNRTHTCAFAHFSIFISSWFGYVLHAPQHSHSIFADRNHGSNLDTIHHIPRHPSCLPSMPIQHCRAYLQLDGNLGYADHTLSARVGSSLQLNLDNISIETKALFHCFHYTLEPAELTRREFLDIHWNSGLHLHPCVWDTLWRSCGRSARMQSDNQYSWLLGFILLQTLPVGVPRKLVSLSTAAIDRFDPLAIDLAGCSLTSSDHEATMVHLHTLFCTSGRTCQWLSPVHAPIKIDLLSDMHDRQPGPNIMVYDHSPSTFIWSPSSASHLLHI